MSNLIEFVALYGICIAPVVYAVKLYIARQQEESENSLWDKIAL